MDLSNKAIYIPSRGRATRQFTVDRLPLKYHKITHIVVPEDERRMYLKHNPGVDIMECPVKGIGKTRQWILDNTKAKYILMFDDDMYFYHREEAGGIKLKTNELSDTRRMLRTLFGWLENDGFLHIGLAARPEASFYLCEYRECTRVNNAHGFDVARLRQFQQKHDVRFSDFRVMEDFNMTLTLLRAGIPNRVLLDYVWNQPGSNTDGGCSTYRTEKLQRKYAKRLARRFPEFVKVVEKKVRGATSWEGMKTRTDVRIQWRKAYAGKPRKNWKTERAMQRKVGGK